MKTTLITLILTALVIAGSAQAASINQRQAVQKARIEQGIASGSLTKREAGRMIRQQRQIARKERAYRSDGVLTKYERYDLQTDLNQTNHRIYVQKHDAQHY